MKQSTIIGIILLVLGGVMLTYQGFNYTTKDTVLDLGPLKATSDTTHNVPFSPLLGVIALVGGITLVVAGSRRG